MVYTERSAYHGLTEYQDNVYIRLTCLQESKLRSSTEAKCVHYLCTENEYQEMIKAENIKKEE